MDWYYLLVGHKSTVNEGLGRILAFIASFILVFGVLFWWLMR